MNGLCRSPPGATMWRNSHKEKQTGLGFEGQKRRRARRHARHRARRSRTRWRGEGAGVAVCARNADQVAAPLPNCRHGREGDRHCRRYHRRCRAEHASRTLRGNWVASTCRFPCRRHGAGRRSRFMGAELSARRAGRRQRVRGCASLARSQRRETGDAAFVIISSISAARRQRQLLRPDQGRPDPHGQGTARQYAGKKIRVNVVSLGTVDFRGGIWNMVEQNMPKRYQDALTRNPTGRMATPQEIANAAVFLASRRRRSRRARTSSSTARSRTGRTSRTSCRVGALRPNHPSA